MGSHSAPYQKLKRPESKADYVHAHSTEVKSAWSFPSIPLSRDKGDKLNTKRFYIWLYGCGKFLRVNSKMKLNFTLHAGIFLFELN